MHMRSWLSAGFVKVLKSVVLFMVSTSARHCDWPQNPRHTTNLRTYPFCTWLPQATLALSYIRPDSSVRQTSRLIDQLRPQLDL
jgi:hypothetical protein